MNPTFFGGSDFDFMACAHAIPFSSAQSGVPNWSIKQVKPLSPVWSDFGLPSSCIMMIVALDTICSGAAVFTFAIYSASDFGTSSFGNATAAPIPRRKANVEQRTIRIATSLIDARCLDQGKQAYHSKPKQA